MERTALSITFTIHGDDKVTPMGLAKAIIDSYALHVIWSTNDFSELAEYLEVYVQHHRN